MWINSGETPTKNFAMHASELYSITALPENFGFEDLWDAGEPHVPTPAVIGPKASVGAHQISIPLALLDTLADKSSTSTCGDGLTITMFSPEPSRTLPSTAGT